VCLLWLLVVMVVVQLSCPGMLTPRPHHLQQQQLQLHLWLLHMPRMTSQAERPGHHRLGMEVSLPCRLSDPQAGHLHATHMQQMGSQHGPEIRVSQSTRHWVGELQGIWTYCYLSTQCICCIGMLLATGLGTLLPAFTTASTSKLLPGSHGTLPLPSETWWKLIVTDSNACLEQEFCIAGGSHP
jgi:hypothetical protein